jgi:hypothetical protein
LWKSSFRATEHNAETGSEKDEEEEKKEEEGEEEEEEEKEEEEKKEEGSFCGTAASLSAVSLTWDIPKSACPACLERGAADAADVDCSIET